MDLGIFYTKLGVIILVVALGFLLGRIKIINDKANLVFVNLLLSVLMPASLFSAFPATFDHSTFSFFLRGFTSGVVVLTSVIILAKLLFTPRVSKGEFRYSAQFAFIFNNATFLGYPLISQTFGTDGMMAYLGFIVIFNIALFSYGVWLFERKLSWRLVFRTITNPNIIAVILGAVIFIFSLPVPQFITGSVSSIAGATTPLALICVGFMLSRANLKAVFKKRKLFFTAAAQLVLGPLATWLILTAIGITDTTRAVCVILQALPTATSLALFAKKYGSDNLEASELVVISTLLSVITLPIAVALIF
ncbi:MAG: AEC family transporter [Candidatus Nomurabacteria bacterium]|jgi:predicted permease|nr:AEC family transporter [Candidatus Nomurabacteria bacterium]